MSSSTSSAVTVGPEDPTVGSDVAPIAAQVGAHVGATGWRGWQLAGLGRQAGKQQGEGEGVEHGMEPPVAGEWLAGGAGAIGRASVTDGERSVQYMFRYDSFI